MNNTNAEIQCYVEELLVDLDDTAYFKIPGEKGDKGDPGIAGQDGHSPVVTATKSGKTTTISVDGAAIATVEDGADGKPGAAGAPGKDGHSPVVTATKSGKTTTISVDGAAIATVEDGKPGAAGAPGKDGHSPVVTATKSGKTTTISVDGAAIATVEDGADGKPGAAGAPGKDGHSPVVTATKSGKTTTISVDGTDIATVEDGADGKPGAAGADGITPTIGSNGNWYLGSTDTGKPSRGATGPQGAPGKDGAGMDITGATVGQIAKITAVDASGVPTAWSPADMPSGGSSDAVLYTAQELTYGQKFQARKNIEAADSVWPTITGGVSLCPEHVTDSNTAVHAVTTTASADDFTLTLDGGPEDSPVLVKGIRTPTDADTDAAATVEYVKAKVASGGITPHIGDNGNWYLGDTDTGKPSRGEQGPGAEVYYVDLAGNYPSYTCATAMADIAAAYASGKELTCRFAMGMYTAVLPLFLPMPSTNTWIFSGAGALSAMGFPAQTVTIAIVNGTVQASDTQLASMDDIPTIPTALPNPNALTIKIGGTTVTYDGSAAKTVEIADGSEVAY